MEKVTYVFGSDAIDMIMDGEHTRKIKKAIEKDCSIGAIIQKKFNTKEERAAYEEALEDISGWNDYVVL